MLYELSYYLTRISPYMYLCIIGVFIHSAMRERKKHICGDASFCAAAARTLLPPYILFLLFLTIFIRLQNNEISFKLIPFTTYSEAFKSGDKALIFQYIGNILIFIPFGFLLPACAFSIKRRRLSMKETVVIGLFVSLFIEIFQLITRFGTFEVDDIINNFIGVITGCIIFAIIKVFAKLINKKDDGI